ncbi:aspartate/glutamate racemase family protein [Mesorhizobium carmichaelinearum]|uniref:aspartate/glutamate racemase family protein n=1 Tax=Mesorhizobium carmichaelinearum TaxID=1208188 RepID=UPI000BA442E4|nr:aspartate/glutamate racemase family protein [Mesorhizobium carmichaelinearum]
MIFGTRDSAIDVIRARVGTYAYGMGLGVMLVDEVYPGFPGDVRNASAYPFPIQYDIVQGVDIDKLVFHEEKSACLEPILQAARRLERIGCRAIVAECGGFAYFQKEVAAEVSVPVFMSSLLQVPFAQQMTGMSKKVGIVCAYREHLTEHHLVSCGIDPASNLAVMGACDDYSCPEFDNLWNASKRPAIPTAGFARAETDFVSACKDFVSKNPDLRALVFICTGFQPFARSVQREVGLPIFSWGTLLDYAFSIVSHRDYYGYV